MSRSKREGCQCRKGNEPSQITPCVCQIHSSQRKLLNSLGDRTALKNLQASETAHKQTSSELQRTRTTLQGLRATHVAELKKKEKDVDRIMEKWQKLADSQARLSVLPSGMHCANVAVIEGSEILGRKCQGFLEIAREEAEQARASLEVETVHLRKLILSTVNEVQSILYQAQTLLLENESLEAVRHYHML